MYVLYHLFCRLEFGTAAQPPTTPQAGAEKPLSPTGDRREYEFLIEHLNNEVSAPSIDYVSVSKRGKLKKMLFAGTDFS